MPTFTSAIGPVIWEANATLLTIEMAGRTHLLPWEEMRGAGVVLLPQGSAVDAPMGRHLVIAPARENYLLRIPLGEQVPVGSEQLSVSSDQLSVGSNQLSVGSEQSSHDARLVTHDSALNTDTLNTDSLTTDALTADALPTDALVAELRARLGTRFYTDLTPDTYRTVLIPPWSNLPDWVMPVVVLGFIGLSALFLLFMLLVSMPRGGEWSIIWWQVVVGLLAWIVIVSALLGAYRKLWTK